MLTQRCLTLAGLTALVTLAGCASDTPSRPHTTTADTRPTAAAEYGLVSRELVTTEQASIDSVYNATQSAMRDLELSIVDKTKDRLNATIAARTAHDERITVSLERLTSGVTDVKIKVGFWGDEAQSRAVLTAIRRQLAVPADKEAPAQFMAVSKPATGGAVLGSPTTSTKATQPVQKSPVQPTTKTPTTTTTAKPTGTPAQPVGTAANKPATAQPATSKVTGTPAPTTPTTPSVQKSSTQKSAVPPSASTPAASTPATSTPVKTPASTTPPAKR